MRGEKMSYKNTLAEALEKYNKVFGTYSHDYVKELEKQNEELEYIIYKQNFKIQELKQSKIYDIAIRLENNKIKEIDWSQMKNLLEYKKAGKLLWNIKIILLKSIWFLR
jgi:hypothetical protein